MELFDSSATADAVIIGGGVIGLTIARALRLRGVKRVVLVERDAPGMEASHAAAGMLAPQVEADRADAFLELACASRDLYPSFAATLFEETGLEIELEQTGTLLLAFNEQDEAAILHRYSWQSRAGLSVEHLTQREARELEPNIAPDVRSALRFPRDWQVENRRLVVALVAAIEKLGVQLLTGTHAKALRTERGRVTGVETSRGTISAPVVIIANGAWASLISATDKRGPHIRIEPVRGQMLCFAADQVFARHVIYSPRGYIVPRLDRRLLAGSTTERAGFDKRVTDEGQQAVMAQALEIAPAINQLPLAATWAGLRPRAEDNLPVLGMSAEVEGLCYAAGHYRNGILLAPMTGELIAGEVLGGDGATQHWSAFSPNRFQLVNTG